MMTKETLDDRAVSLVMQRKGADKDIALRVGVEVSEVKKLIEQRDERVMDEIRAMTGLGGKIRAVDTEVKKFIEKIIRAAAWDKRLYAVFGPTGCGKTIAVQSVVQSFREAGENIQAVRVYRFDSPKGTMLLRDIADGFKVLANKTQAWSSNMYIFQKLRDYFEAKKATLVIDEAQRLKDPTYEIIRDLYDESQLSIVIVGSMAFEDKLSAKKITDEVFGQFLRRLGPNRYKLPSASSKDVRTYLSNYGIELETREALQIAKRIGRWGDIDTLSWAMRLIVADIEDGELSWKKVGAGQIVEAVERVVKLASASRGEEKE